MAQGQPTPDTTQKPKMHIPWLWLAPAILVTTCLMCPCGFGSGWWFGSRGPSSSSIPLIGGGSPLGKFVCETPGKFIGGEGVAAGCTLDFEKDGNVAFSEGQGSIAGNWRQDGSKITTTFDVLGSKLQQKATLQGNTLTFDGGSVWKRK